METEPTLLITVDTENWYNSRLFNADRVRLSSDASSITSADEDLGVVLDLFAEHGVKATFFVLGSLLEDYPAIPSNIESRGHEVGMHAYNHLEFPSLEAFLQDIHKGLSTFHAKTGKTPRGYRHPYFMANPKKLEELSKHFEYDASIVPSLHIPGHYGHPTARTTPTKLGSMIELPLSVTPYIRLPAATGWYYRNLGQRYIHWIIDSSLRNHGYAQICLHTWEFTPKRCVRGVPAHVFRNCGKPMVDLIEELQTIAEKRGARITTCAEYTKTRNVESATRKGEIGLEQNG